ncbi:hypothetical protein GCM10018775_92570 [Streptomyces umbrinus]|nr:hypothetical protein GCM10018775_92570 [Streptomyces umbrinus]
MTFRLRDRVEARTAALRGRVSRRAAADVPFRRVHQPPYSAPGMEPTTAYDLAERLIKSRSWSCTPQSFDG